MRVKANEIVCQTEKYTFLLTTKQEELDEIKSKIAKQDPEKVLVRFVSYLVNLLRMNFKNPHFDLSLKNKTFWTKSRPKKLK